MADPEAVILSARHNMAAVISSAIESLDRWLLKNDDPWKHSYERLGSLVVGMADFGEENKEKILSFMVGMADSWDEKKRRRLYLWEDPWRDNKEKMYRLVVGMMDLGEEDRKKKMYNLVVGMAEFWEDNNNREKLYSLLCCVARPSRKKMSIINMEYLMDMLVEITDLLGDDMRKLHKLLVPTVNNYYSIYENRLYSLMVEMGSNQVWKLNKEKLYTWLASKVDLWEDQQQLFGLMFDIARYQDDNTYIHKLTRKDVEGARNELRLILDFITASKWEDQVSNSLHYFIFDAAEMANDAQLLIQLKDSDPFILVLQMFIFRNDDCISQDARQFSDMIKFIYNWVQETKERMFEFVEEKAIGEGSKYLVGLEEDIDLLLHKEDIGTITFIRGMVGIGKTTLATELYNRAIVDDRFEHCALVVDKRDVSFEKMDNRSIRHMVRRHLEGKRYFIVLDDVWEEASMEYFMEAFPQDTGSRLLLTTSNNLLRIDNRTDYNHHMKFLDDDKSWQLLMNTAFFGATDKKFSKHFEKKGREMLKKCSGLPLAIKEVGRQWEKMRQSGIEWEELLNEAPNLDETLLALESTYCNFKPELKSCFLHLAFFKEGTTTKVKRLVHIWMIGGLESEEWRLQQYLPRLCDESIIQVIDREKAYGKIKTCRINAIFHRLSIKKAEDELSFEILQKDGYNRPSHEARHRVIYCGREKLTSCSMNQDKHLVSLFFRGGGYFDGSPSYWKQFEQLKILDMEDFGLKILPDAIGTLIELRYLGLRNNYIQELPRSLYRLKKLEVLDIALNFMVLLPDIIWDMDSLSNIYISDIICGMPLKISSLEKLKTLNFISINSWSYEQSQLKMKNLVRLGVEEVDEDSDMRKLFVSLEKSTNFQCLILRGFRFKSMPSLDELCILKGLCELKLDGNLTRLPRANNFPPNIRSLSLVNSCLEEDPMPILEKLSLLYLKLQNAYTGQQMVISPNKFPGLEYLVIGELWHLRNVQVAKGTMQHLRQLEIYTCPYLEILPEEILSINSLEKLKIVLTKNIATEIRKSGFLSRISEVDIQP